MLNGKPITPKAKLRPQYHHPIALDLADQERLAAGRILRRYLARTTG
jgi:hypothetical protein